LQKICEVRLHLSNSCVPSLSKRPEVEREQARLRSVCTDIADGFYNAAPNDASSYPAIDPVTTSLSDYITLKDTK